MHEQASDGQQQTYGYAAEALRVVALCMRGHIKGM